MTKPSVSVFFPCYNDKGTIGSLVLLAHQMLKKFTNDFEVIVVNDASTDGSDLLLEKLKKIYPETLKIIHHKSNLGYGGALMSGFQNASKEWVGYTDGDGQYDIDELERFFPLLKPGTDWVQGFKGMRRDPWYRILVGLCYQYFIKLVFQLKIRDVDCDFRFVRNSILKNIQLKQNTGAICVELVKKLELKNAKCVEVQVSHYFRLHGKSQFFNFIRISKTLLKLSMVWLECFKLKSFKKNLNSLEESNAQDWNTYQQKMKKVSNDLEELNNTLN